MAAPLIKPAVPLVTPIPGGFLNGKLIRLEGASSPSAQRFAINIQCGPNTSPRDDIALHVAVNFSDRSVSRNSLNLSQWGQEERQGGFPFQQGEGFEILLLADSNHYKIAINGQHFAEFYHRMAPERVTHLTVDGDVMLTSVSFEGAESVETAPLSSASAPPQAAPIMPTSSPAPLQNSPYGAPPYPMQPSGAPYPPAAGAPYGMPPYPPQPGTAPPYPNAPYGAAPPNPYAPPSQYPGAPYPPAPGPYAQGPYPPAPGYPQGPYGYPQNPGQYPPGYGPYPPPPGAYPPGPGQYPGVNPSNGSAGLGGILGKAGAAVAGALGATGLLGLAGNRGPSSYPYPGAAPGYGGGGGGGLLGAASSAIGAAAMGSALLNPKKAMKQQHKAQKNALKYGLPVAGVGLGAYALHKGLKHGFHGGHSSSSSSSEEE